MLEDTDTLLSMAEITAVFAGFAALVTVIRRGSDQPGDAVHDLLRLRLVIASSVTGVAAALVPVGLAGYGLDPGLTWRLAALIFLILDNGVIVSFLGSYKPVRGTFPPDRMAVILVSLLEVVEQVSLLAVILGVTFGSASALYVTALIANLCQAGFIFVRFVGSSFRQEQRRISGGE
jgi:O-antigen/teichoic acid export membrane protein